MDTRSSDDRRELRSYERLRNIYRTGDESGREPEDDGAAFTGLKRKDEE